MVGRHGVRRPRPADQPGKDMRVTVQSLNPPEAPSRRYRGSSWKAVDLVSVYSTFVEGPHQRTVRFGLAPVQGGRIVMRGARCLSVKLQARDPRDVVLAERRSESLGASIQEDSSEALRRELDRKYLVAWSARTEAASLDEVFCEGRTHWLRRTIEVRRLASLTDRLSGRDFGPDSPVVFDLPSVARRYRVPEPQPRDALDAAVLIAELFLVLATKLAALGYADMASLLQETSFPRSRPTRPIVYARISQRI